MAKKPNPPKLTFTDRKHPDYVNQLDTWDLMEDAFVGQTRIKEKNVKYLPLTEIEQNEGAGSNTRYSKRLELAVYFNGVKRLARYAIAQLFRIPPSFDALPKELQDLNHNVDRFGTSAATWWQNHCTMSYVMGHQHVLTEYPDTSQFTNKQQEKEANLRPYFVSVHPSEIINWKARDARDGVISFDWVVRRETSFESTSPNDPHERVTRYRVYYPDRWELYEVKEGASHAAHVEKTTDKLTQRPRTISNATAQLVGQGSLSLGEVPMSTVYSNMVRPMVSLPPLEDSANLNIHHYRMFSSLTYAMFHHLAPLLHLSGVNKIDSVKVGAKAAIITPKGGDAKYVEFTGTGMKTAKDASEDIAREMWEAGMKSSSSIGSNASAEARRFNRSDFVAWLHSVADLQEYGINAAYGQMAKWKGIKDFDPTTKTVKLNRDFDLSALDANQSEFLLNARKAGEISRRTFLTECKRGETLSATLDVDNELSEAKKDLEADLEVIMKLQQATAPAESEPKKPEENEQE